MRPPAHLLLALAIASPGPAVADDAGPTFTLEECLRAALASNAQVAASGQDAAMARARIVEADAARYPRVDLTGAYLHLEDPPRLSFEGQVFPIGRSDAFIVDIGARHTLYSGGAVGAGVRAAENGERAVEASRRSLEEDVALAVHRAFYSVLFAREVVEVRRAARDLLANHLEETRVRYRHGDVSEYEVLRAEVELANHRPLVVGAEHELGEARDRLTRLMGQDLARPVDALGKLEAEPGTEDLQESVRMAAGQRHDLRAAHAREEAADALLEVAQAGKRPQVSLFAHVFVASPEFLVGSSATPAADAVAGVSVGIPLFTGHADRGRVERAQAEALKARALGRDLGQQAELEVREAWRRLEQARATLEAQGRVVEQAERALDIARVRYRQGLGTQLEVTDAQLALEEAKLVRLGATRDLVTARAELRRARGESLLPEEVRHVE